MNTPWKEIARIEDDFKYMVMLGENEGIMNPLIALGLNPSGNTDGEKLSPTSLRLTKFAIGNGNDGVVILNLCPLVNVNPKKIKDDIRAVGHDKNIEVMEAVAAEFPDSPVLLCFGHNIKRRKLQSFLYDELIALGYRNGRKFFIIENNGRIHPPHPSRAKGASIVPFSDEVIKKYLEFLKVR